MDSEESIPQKNRVVKPHVKKGFFIAIFAVFVLLLTFTTIKALSVPSLEKILENQEKITEQLTEMQKEIAKLELLQKTTELNAKQIKKLKEEITIIRNENSNENNYDKSILGIFDLTSTISATPTPINKNRRP